MTKTCKDCQSVEPAENFDRDKRRKDGRHPYCKSCRSSRAAKRYKGLDPVRQSVYSRDYYAKNREQILDRMNAQRAALPPDVKRQQHRKRHLKTAYGITPEDYDVLLQAQDGVCGICGVLPASTLAVDHDHASGEVRGLLCRNCNLGLGNLGDSIEGVQAALAYLEKNS